MNKIMMFNISSIKSMIKNKIDDIAINRKKLLFCGILILGLWFGAVQYTSNIDSVNKVALQAIKFITECSYIRSFLILSIINIFIINIIFLNGFNSLGLPVIIFSPFFYGAFTGLLNSWLYTTYKINGVFYCIINIIPFATITSIFIIITCNNSLKFSCKSAKAIIFGESSDRGEVKQFIINHFIITAVTIILSLLQTLLITNLTDKLITLI